ncbi:MAG: 30S ribosomal protein S15 [Patescibacteria group bacterium]
MLTTRKKKIIINEYKVHDKDTGSTAVQVALLSRQIADLTSHLKKNKKDNISRRGLLKMVGKRRRLVNYLEKVDPKTLSSLTKKLDL